MSEPQAVVKMLDQVEEPEQQVFQAIVKAMNTPGFNPELLERMYGFHRQMKADAAEDAYWAAMRECQLDMKPIQRKVWNQETKSHYAKLHHIQREIKPIYEKHGFGMSFTGTEQDNVRELPLVAIVSHEAGHRQRYQLKAEIDDKGPKGGGTKTSVQGTLSTSTQLRKKLLELIFDLILTDDDNDGNRIKPDNKITQEQADTLNTMLNDLGMTSPELRKGFYAYCTPDNVDIITRIDDIPATKYAKAVAMLEAKARQKK